jgi:hypothetical protein
MKGAYWIDPNRPPQYRDGVSGAIDPQNASGKESSSYLSYILGGEIGERCPRNDHQPRIAKYLFYDSQD